MTQDRATTTGNAHTALLLLAVTAAVASWSECASAEASNANPPAIPAPTTAEVAHPSVVSFPVEPPTSTEHAATETPARGSIAELATSAPVQPVQTAQAVQRAPPVAAGPTVPASGSAATLASSNTPILSTPGTSDANFPSEGVTSFSRTFPNHPDQKDQAPLARHRKHSELRQLGMTFDVGLPDGAIVGVAYRPAFWTRLQAGAGTNAVSPGVRAGASLVPFGSGPSLTLEGGYYLEGDANSVIGKVAGSSYSNSRTGERIGYQFVNMHVGLDFGLQYATFFLHGGMTYLHTRLHDAGDALGGQSVGSDGSVTTYQFNQDLTLNAFFPSFKLGIIVYLV